MWVGAEEWKLQPSSLTDLLKHFPPAIVPSFLDTVLLLLKWDHILVNSKMLIASNCNIL